jgi:hypothetical protein
MIYFYHFATHSCVIRCVFLHACFCMQSDDKLQEFKQIAASLQQPVKAALTGSSQRSSSRELVLPVKREIGDCYIWGSWSDAEVGLTQAGGYHVIRASAGAVAVAGVESIAVAGTPPGAGVSCNTYAVASAVTGAGVRN